MAYPGPGTTLPDGVVYKTAALAQYIPAGQVPPQYADLEFGYGQSSSSTETSVTIGGTAAAPTLDYTDVSGSAASLSISSVGTQGPNGFQFTDNSGTLWTVLDQPVSNGVAADPLLTQAIAMELFTDPALAVVLEEVKTTLDALTGGNPIVFPTNPLGGAPCFARGTRLRTPGGEVAVEDLAEGDRVTLAAGGEASIRWIGRRRVHVARHQEPETVAPIRVEAGALGDQTPLHSLRLSPDHALLLGGVLVPAGLLVNGDTIVRETVETVEYFHIELPNHAVVLAEGAPAETYLDTGNRAMFANAPMLNSEHRAGSPCANMVLGGERLDQIRRSLPVRVELRMAS